MFSCQAATVADHSCLTNTNSSARSAVTRTWAETAEGAARTGTADVAIYLTSSQLLEQGNGQRSRRSFNYCSRAAIRWFCASAFCKDDFAKTFRQWLYSTGKTDILITLHNGVELKGYIVVKNYTKFMATLLKTPVLNIFFCNVFQLQVIQVSRACLKDTYLYDDMYTVYSISSIYQVYFSFYFSKIKLANCFSILFLVKTIF